MHEEVLLPVLFVRSDFFNFQNKSLTDAIYMSHWYKYDTRTRKILLIIMERSKKPMVVTTGKIFSLTYSTFISVNFVSLYSRIN